jgi:hypothetical protein
LNGAQGRSLSAIRGLCDTGASLHNGIEPPTRGFSVLTVNPLVFINQRVTGALDALDCSTVHNGAQLIHAKLTQHKNLINTKHEPIILRTTLPTLI